MVSEELETNYYGLTGNVVDYFRGLNRDDVLKENVA